MAADAATEGLLQQAPLGPQAGPGQLGQDLGVALTGTSAASMARPEVPKMSLATTESLSRASSSTCSTRCCSAVLVATRSAR